MEFIENIRKTVIHAPTVGEPLSVVVEGENYFRYIQRILLTVNTDNGARRQSATNENQA